MRNFRRTMLAVSMLVASLLIGGRAVAQNGAALEVPDPFAKISLEPPKGAVSGSTAAPVLTPALPAPPPAPSSSTPTIPTPAIPAAASPSAASPAPPSPAPVPGSPSLTIRYPNGASISCPLKQIHSSFLIFFSNSELDPNPSQSCLTLVSKLERDQNIQDLRALLLVMKGSPEEEYEKALAEFLLAKIGVPRWRISEARARIDFRPFLKWSDQEIVEYLNKQYDQDTQFLQRINRIRREHPGALRGG